jgi:hypothetical protein
MPAIPAYLHPEEMLETGRTGRGVQGCGLFLTSVGGTAFRRVDANSDAASTVALARCRSDAPPARELPEGHGYRVGVLGHGGMGIVYRLAPAQDRAVA